VNGQGPIGAGEPAQNGILVTGNSFASVENNTISDFAYTGQSGSASGITFLGANGAATGNMITDSQEGAVAAADTPGSWTVAIEDNEINGSSVSALHAEVSDADASITLVLQNNDLTGGSGDGINIGLPLSQSPAGNITLLASMNLITGWNCDVHLVSSVSENSTVSGNVIEDAADSGVRAEQSINASNVMVTYNSIAQNSNFGVFNNGSGTMDARNNWWGDASGPYNQQLNPSGRGDNVSDNVNFQPWLEQQPGQPIVEIEPSLSAIAPGETCNITVNTLNVTDLTGWQFELLYRNDVVNCTGVSEGPFLKSEGGTFFIAQINNAYNSTDGCVLVACSLEGQDVSVNGSGTIATLSFTALSTGNTTLALVNTELSDEQEPPQPIDHVALTGVIYVASPHDVAVVNVTTSKTGGKPTPIVGLGYNAQIIVTVGNIGPYTETFNVTAYANSTAIGTVTATNLAPQAQEMLLFTWNTGGFAYGNYTISAYAWPVQNEINIGNNNMTGGTVHVGIPGDINGDGTVDIFDAVLFARSFGATPGSSYWNPNADLNGDGSVDIFDAVILAGHFNQHYP
jgi:hypothetical protein